MKGLESPRDNINHDDLRELIPLYALGGLDEAESAQIEALLLQEPELMAEVEEYMSLTGMLAQLPPPLEPAADLTADLMKRVELNAAARFGPAPVTSTAKERTEKTTIQYRPKIQPLPKASVSPPVPTAEPKWWESLFGKPLVGALSLTAALGFAILVGFMGAQLSVANQQLTQAEERINQNGVELAQVGDALETAEMRAAEAETDLNMRESALATSEAIVNNQAGEIEGLQSVVDEMEIDFEEQQRLIAEFENQLVDQDDQIADLSQVVGLFNSTETQRTTIIGTEEQPEAFAQIVFNPISEVAILVVDGLPELEDGQVYQVLLIRGSEHDTADTFSVTAEGSYALIIESPSPMEIFDAVGVSIEPEGGSQQRTGDIVLFGDIENKS